MHPDPEPTDEVVNAAVVCRVTRGQLLFFGFLGICVALHPGFVLKRDEGGVSNYGIHIKTAIPYSLAYLGCAWCSFRAAALLRPHDTHVRILQWVLRSFAFMMMLVLVSSYIYRISSPLDDLHGGINATVAVLETAATVWLYRTSATRRTLVAWSALELAGILLGALTVVNVVHLVFVAEVAMATGFGVVLVKGTRSLTTGADT